MQKKAVHRLYIKHQEGLKYLQINETEITLTRKSTLDPKYKPVYKLDVNHHVHGTCTWWPEVKCKQYVRNVFTLIGCLKDQNEWVEMDTNGIWDQMLDIIKNQGITPRRPTRSSSKYVDKNQCDEWFNNKLTQKALFETFFVVRGHPY